MAHYRVRDLMTRGVFAVLPHDDLATVRRLMWAWQVRHAPVVDESNVVVGLVSDRDLMRQTLLGHPGVSEQAVEEQLRALTVRAVMQPRPMLAEEDEPIADVAGNMLRLRVDGALVVDEAMRLTGILTEADFVRWFARHDCELETPVLAAAGAVQEGG
jgi:CBS domain-containing protein